MKPIGCKYMRNYSVSQVLVFSFLKSQKLRRNFQAYFPFQISLSGITEIVSPTISMLVFRRARRWRSVGVTFDGDHELRQVEHWISNPDDRRTR